MLDITTGKIRIDNELIVYPGYLFIDFKKTKYYTGQDSVRVIYLEQVQKINNYQYYVSLFFNKDKLYSVSLINCDKNIFESNERDRKLIHDRILEENNIKNNASYKWGKIVSEYDPKSNISSINIFYE